MNTLDAATRARIRDAGCAYEFMHDLASRFASRIQLTTDGHKAYIDAVAEPFGPANIDYAMLVKLFGETPTRPGRYSSPACIGIDASDYGRPRGRAHLDLVRRAREPHVRMQSRRFTRLTNAFSKKGGEPPALGRDHVHALQLLPRSPDAPRDCGDGRWPHRSRVGDCGPDRAHAKASCAAMGKPEAGIRFRVNYGKPCYVLS
jgi:hypothetical protein